MYVWVFAVCYDIVWIMYIYIHADIYIYIEEIGPEFVHVYIHYIHTCGYVYMYTGNRA